MTEFDIDSYLDGIDLNSVEEPGIKPGVYNAVVCGAEMTKTKTGKPMLVVTFKVAEGTCKGETIKSYKVLPDKKGEPEKLQTNLRYFKKHLVSLGVEGEFNEVLRDPAEYLKGNEVTITVDQQLESDFMSVARIKSGWSDMDSSLSDDLFA